MRVGCDCGWGGHDSKVGADGICPGCRMAEVGEFVRFQCQACRHSSVVIGLTPDSEHCGNCGYPYEDQPKRREAENG